MPVHVGFLPDSLPRLPVACIVAAALSGCTSSPATGVQEFTVRVDSITGPTAVSGGVYAEQQLWGLVGPSNCTSVKEIRSTRLPSTMDVTVIGVRDNSVMCGSDANALNGVTVRIEPLIPYDFQLIVHQPDGSTLLRRIYGE